VRWRYARGKPLVPENLNPLVSEGGLRAFVAVDSSAGLRQPPARTGPWSGCVSNLRKVEREKVEDAGMTLGGLRRIHS